MAATVAKTNGSAARLEPVAGRVPPSDLDAEAAVLSACIDTPAAFDDVRKAGLRGEHFYSDSNRRIYEALGELTAAEVPADIVSIADLLRKKNRLDQVGGTPYLAEILTATPAVAHVTAHAEIVRCKAQLRALIASCQKIAAEGYSATDPALFVADAKRAIAEIDQGRSAAIDLLGQHWVRLDGSPELLLEAPPKQVWLLDRYSDQRSIGVFPRGRTGLVTGTGGVSKTYLATQMAIAVASGGFLLDTFRAAGSGHVLLALGEEDLEEARRRLWRAANAAELSTDQRREIAARIDLLPLAGVPVALTASPAPGVVLATEIAGQLRKHLEDRKVDWALIVIEPLSRWAGGGVEIDNEAATRFVQILETLCTVQGSPSVIVCHHSSKASARDGASDARGVTGIRDAFRWMISLDAVEDPDTGARGVRLRNTKSNYSLEFDELMLVKNTDPGIEGTLRLAGAGESDGLQPRGGKRPVTDEEMRERVLETVRRRPGLRTATQISDLTQGTKGKVLEAVKGLRRDGRLVLVSGSFEVSDSEVSNQ